MLFVMVQKTQYTAEELIQFHSQVWKIHSQGLGLITILKIIHGKVKTLKVQGIEKEFPFEDVLTIWDYLEEETE